MKINQTSVASWTLVLSLCAVIPSTPAQATNTLALDAPGRVEDAALLNGEFAAWNFGASPYLEVGRIVGIYAEHDAVSLIRFDLKGVRADKITSARLMFYKPRSFSQLRPVEIAVYGVPQENRGWREGREIAAKSETGASWSSLMKFFENPLRTDAGKTRNNAALAQTQPALDTQTARDDTGHWLTFDIPVALVEQWIAHPEMNAGVFITLATPGRDSQWGDHIYLNSSEHYDGNGPRLILTGAALSQTIDSAPPSKPVFHKLAKDAEFYKWTKSSKRLARFARDAGLNENQTLLFCYFDTEIRGKYIFARYQEPLGILREELLKNITSKDEAATRATLDRFREGLLVWEYIRENIWYTAGTLAENISSQQLIKLYAGSMWTRLEECSNAARKTTHQADADEAAGVWVPLHGAALRARQQEVLQRIIDHTRLSDAQVQKITPVLNEYVRLENEHTRLFRHYLDANRASLANDAGDGDIVNDDAKWNNFRLMFHHHEALLYYQSIYNTPRWHLLTENTPVLDWGQWIAQVGIRYAPPRKR